MATVDQIDISSDAGGNLGIEAMRGLQIVNGGQTTASLHRARKQDKSDLSGVVVPAKIIKVRTENLDAMVAAVSRSANSQNTIQPADFSANDPFHVAVENLANNTWLPDQKGRWFYERARGSYGAAELKASFKASEKRRFANETPKERRFSKTDLAKCLPNLVSFGNRKKLSIIHADDEGTVPGRFCSRRRVVPGIHRQGDRIPDRAGDREGAEVSRVSGEHRRVHGRVHLVEIRRTHRFRTHLVSAVRFQRYVCDDRQVGD